MDGTVGGVSTKAFSRALPGKFAVAFRRSSFVLIALAVFAIGSSRAFEILSANGMLLGEYVVFSLFLLSFAIVSISFSNSLLGFLIMLIARKPEEFACPVAATISGEERINTKTALIVPVYNEDPVRVAARIRALWESVVERIPPEQVAIFVLSDTQDRTKGSIEGRIFAKLRTELGGKARLTYRRRVPNRERKAGNIMDFCDKWGDDWEFMLVMDADSVMSGKLIARLIRIMQKNPKIALLQTVPLVVFAETAFGRILQFGHRVCGELLTAGCAYWQLSKGNYFGHNAIIRVNPFKTHCRLPKLPGAGTLSGEILSHDFVEASYLIRAGYEVWNLPCGEGSFEEMPSNIIDYAKRDKRWCQGNLQHSRIMIERGLHPISRFHLLQGIMAYGASLLWCVVIAVALTKFTYDALSEPVYFTESRQLFPVWPEFRTSEAIELFMSTMALLVAPKIFGLLYIFVRRGERRRYLGLFPLVFSLLVETVYTTLMAPVMMVFNTIFIVSILTGGGVKWSNQPRDARGLSWKEAFFALRWQVLVGLLLLGIICLIIPEQFWWTSPLILGLNLCVPIAVFSSGLWGGRILRRIGLFCTPEEVTEVAELKVVEQYEH